MEAKEYLQDYAQKADRLLDQFFAHQKTKAAKISPLCTSMTDVYRDFMRGGKMARGALMKLGYECAGGRETRKILRASLYPEIIHSFLLMHDDVMDRDQMRRGKPAVHVVYAGLGRKKLGIADSAHYGLSMAVCLGDLGNYLAQEVLLKSGFKTEKIVKLLDLANRIFINTDFGQAMDVTGQASGKFNKDYVLKIFQLKTAEYSLVGPMQFGAVLAGVNGELLKVMRGYGLPVGIAFQLQDDILSLFGQSALTGKEAGERDIKEGTLTLLIVEAKKKASQAEKRFLKSVYGKGKVGKKEVEGVKEIIKKTGALDYCQKEARRLVEKGKKFVPQITPDPGLQETLYKMADFMIEREK